MGWHGDAAGTVVYSEPGMRLVVAVGSKNIKSNTRAVFYGYRWLGTGEDERRKFVGKLSDVEARWRDWAAKPLPVRPAEEARGDDCQEVGADEPADTAPETHELSDKASSVVGDGPEETGEPEGNDATSAFEVHVGTFSFASQPKKPVLYSVTYSRPDGGSVNVVAFTDEQTALSSAIEYGRVLEAIGVAGDFSVDEVPIGWD